VDRIPDIAVQARACRAARITRRPRLAPTLVLAMVAAATVLLAATGLVSAAPPPGYYDTVDTTNAATLRVTVHDVIKDHQRFPYTSSGTDTWDILEAAQEDPDNPSNIVDIYKNASYAKAGGGNSFYNREHVWPNSYGFPNDTGSNYPYTDCHALSLCDIAYNSDRGNNPFRYCDASCTPDPTVANNGRGGVGGAYPSDSNWYSGSGVTGTWEVWAGRRGDVARSMFYLDVRYEGGTHGITGAAEPDLILTDDESLIAASATGSNESVAYMGMRSVLYAWNLEDPVDDMERARNDVVFSFQGNRNPFIDHPEWADVLFGQPICTSNADCDDGAFCNGAETCNGAGVCIAGADPCPGLSCNEATDQCEVIPTATPWINEIHYDNDGTDVGEFVEIAGPSGLNLAGWTLVGYNGAVGDPYDTINLTGTLPEGAGCLGTLAFDFPGLQNGPADGLALVDPADGVVEFISYAGSFTALSGPAQGMTSTDIGVSEPSNTLVGYSLQLSGTGAVVEDFQWQPPGPQTRGTVNTNQVFDACVDVPATSTWGLVALALSCLSAGTITILRRRAGCPIVGRTFETRLTCDVLSTDGGEWTRDHGGGNSPRSSRRLDLPCHTRRQRTTAERSRRIGVGE